MAAGDRDEAQRRRLLRFLRAGAASVAEGASAGDVLVEREGGAVSVRRAVLRAVLREGLAEVARGRLRLSGGGLAQDDASDGDDPLGARRRALEPAILMTDDGPETLLVNRAESPLGQLAALKARDGGRFLSADEVRAGERLRADYTRGQLMPRLGAAWVASVASGRRSGGVAELTDAALAARMRVEKAVAAVGPELSGVLVDVCCFLKGMETVERERGWPVRSAKVVLKSALGALARHYDPGAAECARRRIQPLHWGAEDYRPSIM